MDVMRWAGALVAATALLLVNAPAAAQDAPHERAARAMLAELVSFRTAAGHGQVPAMVDHMVAALQAGGVPEADIVRIPHGETEALLVRIPGRDARARPILFSSHMDVVDARPEDWERDPFTLIEEDGFFFGRGAADNKTGVTAMLTAILRLTAERHRPRRTLVFGFVGDEETTFDTTRLIAAHPWVRNAEYAINTDSGGGVLDAEGRPLLYLVQSAEKTYATFRLEARNPGGHSSRPRPDNAIYDLAGALLAVEALRFPVMTDALTTSYFAALGRATPGAAGAMLRRFAADPHDAEARAALLADPSLSHALWTTCVATMLEAGHAENALPQRAAATVNCRIFPGTAIEEVRGTLAEAVGPGIAVTVSGDPEVGPVSEPRADVMAAIAREVHRRHPGLPVAPYMESGATDGLIYRNAGIPTFGTSGGFARPGESFAHGLNERIRVTAFYGALGHVYALAKELGGR
jgi:carboxypeptidase PM20D1